MKMKNKKKKNLEFVKSTLANLDMNELGNVWGGTDASIIPCTHQTRPGVVCSPPLDPNTATVNTGSTCP